MPGPVIPKPTSLFPDWVKPENASVFDPGWRGPLRTLIGLLGLDDPNQVMMAGAAMEAGSPGGGMLEKLAEKFPRVAKAIKAYHGSPHDFAPEPGAPLGRFDMSKMGTGEGGQAFGHGLYFAENPEVAQSYKTSAPVMDVGGTRIVVDPTKRLRAKGPDYAARAMWDTPDKSWAQDRLYRAIKAAGTDRDFPSVRAAQEAYDLIRADKVKPVPGKTYEVNIHADPERFLDWDRPLSEQPHVQAVLDAAPVRKPMDRVPFQRPNVPASEAYRALSERYGSPEAASQALKDAGVPGIKFLDQGSRAAGEGTRNFVVFDDKTIEILRKYGILLPVAGAGSQIAQPPK